jgi:chlorobactene glucosyltransferase
MYKDFRDAVEGIGKNIFDFLGKKTFVLVLMFIAVFFFLFMPFPLLIGCFITTSPWMLHIIVINILNTLTWLFMFLGQRLNWWYGFLWPLLFINLMYMGIWSYYRTISGRGFLWKDRKVE